MYNTFPEFELLRPEDILNNVKAVAHFTAYKFLKKIATNKAGLKVATAESITGGLIFSTLVDIPYGGSYKYGCFGVYDTDAKRTLLGVTTNDVYTHKCVKEMAIGILKNSNATFGIAVSGNAMPIQGLDINGDYTEGEILKLGELFVGIAAYGKDSKIIVKTYVHNMCNIKDDSASGNKEPYKNYEICNLWLNKIINDSTLRKNVKKTQCNISIENEYNGFNNFIITSIVSNIIRYKTVHYAYTDAIDFLNENGSRLITPDFIKITRFDTFQRLSILDGNNCNNKLLEDTRKDIPIDCINNDLCDEDKRESNDLFEKKTGGKRMLKNNNSPKNKANKKADTKANKKADIKPNKKADIKANKKADSAK